MKKWIMRLWMLLGVRQSACFYIGTGTVLPEPLSPGEEAELLSRTPDEQTRRILIEHNLRLVIYIARKFESSGVGLEDLISIGSIGLIKGVNTFDASRHIKLATYASRCIENEILMYLRKIAGKRGEVSIDEPLGSDFDGNELHLSDILGTDPEETSRGVEDAAERELLYQVLRRLDARDLSIITMRYGLDGEPDRTQKQVAQLLHISQSYISRLEKRILARLRQEMQALLHPSR